MWLLNDAGFTGMEHGHVGVLLVDFVQNFTPLRQWLLLWLLRLEGIGNFGPHILRDG